ncbi:hypothetical protein SY89_00109 [Halolamina pelagica]|uniref:Uncharacterized protein n=1 Tax=Halolamina pelagica TaxID=699431 RepID=A0A0P7GLI0_9EURY|nr:hypothetical protein SY89_00109 [Halolamina pelagica]
MGIGTDFGTTEAVSSARTASPAFRVVERVASPTVLDGSVCPRDAVSVRSGWPFSTECPAIEVSRLASTNCLQASVCSEAPVCSHSVGVPISRVGLGVLGGVDAPTKAGRFRTCSSRLMRRFAGPGWTAVPLQCGRSREWCSALHRRHYWATRLGLLAARLQHGMVAHCCVTAPCFIDGTGGLPTRACSRLFPDCRRSVVLATRGPRWAMQNQSASSASHTATRIERSVPRRRA